MPRGNRVCSLIKDLLTFTNLVNLAVQKCFEIQHISKVVLTFLNGMELVIGEQVMFSRKQREITT